MFQDFNYPVGKKEDTMSLQTLDQGKRLRARQEPMALRTDDIAGAQTGTVIKIGIPVNGHNKPNFHGTTDILGASPKRLIPTEVNRQNFNTSSADIGSTKPKSLATLLPQRCTDPNNPKYNLPKVEYRPVSAPKQLRESLKVNDIAGCHPKSFKISTKKMHSCVDVWQVNNIHGAHSDSTLSARMRHSGKDRPVDNPTTEFKIEEISFRTNRVVDPQNPKYKWDCGVLASEGATLIGPIAGTAPKKIPNARQAESALLSLRTNDIPGATPHPSIPRPLIRRNHRNPVDISDIEGSAPTWNHTAFHYKQTSRHLDPLNPGYKPLGWKDNKAPELKPNRKM